jgi:hypothetical protein
MLPFRHPPHSSDHPPSAPLGDHRKHSRGPTPILLHSAISTPLLATPERPLLNHIALQLTEQHLTQKPIASCTPLLSFLSPEALTSGRKNRLVFFPKSLPLDFKTQPHAPASAQFFEITLEKNPQDVNQTPSVSFSWRWSTPSGRPHALNEQLLPFLPHTELLSLLINPENTACPTLEKIWKSPFLDPEWEAAARSAGFTPPPQKALPILDLTGSDAFGNRIRIIWTPSEAWPLFLETARGITLRLPAPERPNP